MQATSLETRRLGAVAPGASARVADTDGLSQNAAAPQPRPSAAVAHRNATTEHARFHAVRAGSGSVRVSRNERATAPRARGNLCA